MRPLTLGKHTPALAPQQTSSLQMQNGAVTCTEDVTPLLTLISTLGPHTWDGFIETCF